MVIKRRIETAEARERRSRRQHFAAPGGSHDKLVAFLARALPMGIGILAALMIITPLSPRGEISFLLDRNKVAKIDERLRVENAMYRGLDDRGRPFSLTAAKAVQKSSREGVVRMDDIVARLLLDEGPARIGSAGGEYAIRDEVVRFADTVRMVAADGYRMVVSAVTVDLDARTMRGTGGVDGAIPAGTFSANTISVNLPERVIVLDGKAKLRMVPGKLRMP